MILDPLGCRCWVAEYVEVPHPDNRPPLRRQVGVDPLVANDVLSDLAIPELTALTRLELRRMAVPERSVHEYGEPRASKGDIRSARQVLAMTPPATDPKSPESASEHNFWLCVPTLDPGHDPTALLRAEDVRHLASLRPVPWIHGTRGA